MTFLYTVLYTVSTQQYQYSDLNPQVLILIDGTCLTSYDFDRSHPVLYYQICILYYIPSVHNNVTY